MKGSDSHWHMPVYSTNERKSCSQTNASLAHRRVATFEMVQGLPTMFAKVQGFQLFLKKLVTRTKEESVSKKDAVALWARNPANLNKSHMLLV